MRVARAPKRPWQDQVRDLRTDFSGVTRVHLALAVVAAVIVAVGVALRSDPMSTELDPEPVIHEVTVQAGGVGMQSVMGQGTFRQHARTTGVSRDTLRFTFDRPVEVVGVLVSVDIRGMSITEVVVGINQPVAYGLEADAWLIHTSDASDGPSKIDEQAWFPVPFEVGPDDYIGVGGVVVEQRRWRAAGELRNHCLLPAAITHHLPYEDRSE